MSESTRVSERFSPVEGQPYGRCTTCEGLSFETPELASAHMHETFEARTSGNSGHSISVTNQPRAQRIEREVRRLVDDAITDAIESIGDLTYGRRGELPDATEEEITRSLHSGFFDGFAEAWDEYLQENSEEDDE